MPVPFPLFRNIGSDHLVSEPLALLAGFEMPGEIFPCEEFGEPRPRPARPIPRLLRFSRGPGRTLMERCRRSGMGETFGALIPGREDDATVPRCEVRQSSSRYAASAPRIQGSLR